MCEDEGMLSYEQGIRMAQKMKEYDPEIQRAIRKTMKAKHGVVALKFQRDCRELEIEILDEPFDDNVRVYPG
jgi:hypothetical protein